MGGAEEGEEPGPRKHQHGQAGDGQPGAGGEPEGTGPVGRVVQTASVHETSSSMGRTFIGTFRSSWDVENRLAAAQLARRHQVGSQLRAWLADDGGW